MRKINDRKKKAIILSSLLLGGVILTGCPNTADDPAPVPPVENTNPDIPYNPTPTPTPTPGPGSDLPEEHPQEPFYPKDAWDESELNGTEIRVTFGNEPLLNQSVIDSITKITMRFPNKNEVDVRGFSDRVAELRKKYNSNLTIEYPTDFSKVTLNGDVYLDQFNEMKGAIFGDVQAKLNDENFDGRTLPKIGNINIIARDTSAGKANIFGNDIDKIAKLYYTKGVVDRYNQIISGSSFVFDANENGEDSKRVYKTNGSLGNPYEVDIAFALLNPSVHLKNVKITDTEKIGKNYGKTDLPALTNVYVEADVDYIKNITEGIGIVEFAGLPPQKTPLMNDGKLIINKTNGNKVGISGVKVLELGADVGLNDFTTPDGGLAQNIVATEVYYRGGVVGNIANTHNSAVYYKDGSDWKQRYLRNGYTPLGLNNNNSWWEDKGNGK